MVHWNTTPEILSLGPIVIRWYGLFFAIAFLLGYRIVVSAFKLDGHSVEEVDQMFGYVFIATLVGARLGHTLFYEPKVYLADPIRILKVWEGGLASHGAAVGILFAMWLYSRKYKTDLLWILDRITIGIALAGAFIRLGNLFNSEIFGKPTNVPWAFIFEKIDNIPRHPTQIYESLAYFSLFALLCYLFFRTELRKKRGFLFGVFLIGVFGFRFLVEFLKENQVAFESSLPLDMGQILSVPLILLGFYLVLRRHPKQMTT